MDEAAQKALDDALFRLAIGIFKRKLPPDLDAIKYLESRQKPGKPRPAAWSPAPPPPSE